MDLRIALFLFALSTLIFQGFKKDSVGRPATSLGARQWTGALLWFQNSAQSTQVGLNGSGYYNFTSNPGNSSDSVATGTYNFVFASNGNEYYEIFDQSGNVVASNLNDPGKVVTLSNVTLSSEYYTVYIGTYGD